MEFAIRKIDLSKNSLPWESNNEGLYGAIVIRYWGCSLSCAICYSQAYAYLDEGGGRKKVNFSIEECEKSINDVSQSVGWTRIQGGEPLLDFERAIFTAKLCGVALKFMENNSPYNNPRVIIQTNGLWFANENEDKLKPFFEELLKQIEQTSKGRIIIELSIKGTNKEIIKKYADTKNMHKDVFEIQKEAFHRLTRIFENLIWTRTDRITFYPVCGLGPSLKNPVFVPVQKINNEIYPFFHPDTWNEEFRKIIFKFIELLKQRENVYKEFISKHGLKIPIESMDTSKFQFGWMSAAKRRPELMQFIKINLQVIKKSNPSLNLYKTNFSEVLENIDESKPEMTKKISDLEKYFYEAEPKNHYPFL